MLGLALLDIVDGCHVVCGEKLFRAVNVARVSVEMVKAIMRHESAANVRKPEIFLGQTISITWFRRQERDYELTVLA